MADDVNAALQIMFAAALAIIAVTFYTKNPPPMSRRFHAVLTTMAIAAGTQAAIILLGRVFGERIPTWQVSLTVATLGLLDAAMLLAVVAARTRVHRRQQPERQEIQRQDLTASQ